MKYSIKRISPHSAGKIFAAISGCFSLIFWPFLLLAEVTAKASAQKVDFPASFNLLFLLFPIFYAVFGYLMTAAMCLVYNFISKFIGHLKIEMELESTEAEGHPSV